MKQLLEMLHFKFVQTFIFPAFSFFIFVNGHSNEP